MILSPKKGFILRGPSLSEKRKVISTFSTYHFSFFTFHSKRGEGNLPTVNIFRKLSLLQFDIFLKLSICHRFGDDAVFKSDGIFDFHLLFVLHKFL
jgi:hypothetical protein